MGVLQRDDVLPAEVLIADEILPVFGFDAESFDRFPAEDIAGILQRDDVRVVCKHLVRDRIGVLALVVSGEIELDEILAAKRLSIDGVRSMLLQPREDIGKVEYSPLRGTDWMIKRLQ